MKKILIISGAIILALFAAGAFFAWPRIQSFITVTSVQYDPQLNIYLGGGGNSVVLTSEDGSKALVIDTKMGRAAQQLRKSISTQDITIVNTHFDIDHIGGNYLYPHATIISGAYTKEQWAKKDKYNRYPDETIKIGEEKVLPVGSEFVHVRNMGRAHTWNDVVVYLEKRKMLITGDIMFRDMHPFLAAEKGSSVSSSMSVLDTLNRIYDVASLVPGHGACADRSLIGTMREYYASISDAIGDPEKLSSLKKKYSGYFSIPGKASFETTVQLIENERKVATH
jgi:glyoxylase-like metal-dependent hydrolase (beta-lactamase superfamily II)